MAKRTINIGLEGNDGTGDNIRLAFQKTNENFTELYALYNPDGTISFASLSDGVDYAPNQIIMGSTDGTKLSSRTLIGSGIVSIDTSNNNQIVISANQYTLVNDLLPILSRPLNAMNNGIGLIPMPTQSIIEQFNAIHGTSASIDTLVVPKLYVDQQVASFDKLSTLRDIVLTTRSTGDLLAFNQATELSILSATVTSGIARLTFAIQEAVPFPTGSIILVANVSPTTYNGIYTVTTGTTSSVSYANSSSGAGTGGTVRNQAWNNITPNNTTTRKFLRQTGTGSSSTMPSWDTLTNTDIPNLSGKTYNNLNLTPLGTGWKVSGGTTPVEVTFIGGLTYTISGTDSTVISLPATSGTLALNNQQFYIGTTPIAINRSTASQSLTGITSIDGYAANLAGGNSSTLIGAVLYQNGLNSTALLPPNITTTKKYLNQTGNGTDGIAPSWNQIDQITTLTTPVLTTSNGGIGYTGTAGGYVAQLTSKSTSVTLDKPTGLIKTHAANLAANTTVSFSLMNSTISTTDLIVIHHVSGGIQFDYAVSAIAGSGSALISIKNLTGGDLAQELALRYVVIKSAGTPP